MKHESLRYNLEKEPLRTGRAPRRIVLGRVGCAVGAGAWYARSRMAGLLAVVIFAVCVLMAMAYLATR
jgi:hypothetical protein